MKPQDPLLVTPQDLTTPREVTLTTPQNPLLVTPKDTPLATPKDTPIVTPQPEVTPQPTEPPLSKKQAAFSLLAFSHHVCYTTPAPHQPVHWNLVRYSTPAPHQLVRGTKPLECCPTQRPIKGKLSSWFSLISLDHLSLQYTKGRCSGQQVTGRTQCDVMHYKG